MLLPKNSSYSEHGETKDTNYVLDAHKNVIMQACNGLSSSLTNILSSPYACVNIIFENESITDVNIYTKFTNSDFMHRHHERSTAT